MAQQMLTVMAAEAAAAHSSSPDQTLPQPQHATPRIKVKGRRRAKSRTSYSLSLKLKAVEEAERSGLRAAAVNLQLDERVLRQWLTKAEDLRQAGLTNSGSTRRLRSRSASASKLANSVASSPEDIEVPDPSPPALASGSSIDRNVALLAVTPPSAGLLANIVHNPLSVSSPSADGSPCSHSTSCSSSLVVSRADACVGTCSASIMTEPEFLGPCEPGTAVTLEGIVWHETEGGVLVVNVTWRGKTYVGTLMDCTKNDWAPPRFCDSPTSDAESRAPKGRAKRGRGASSTPVPTGGGSGGGLSSLVDTSMSPMHSKLRNGAKGRRSVGGSSGGGLPAPPSPAKEAMASGGKRKGSSSSGIGGKNNADDGSASKRSRSSSRGAGSSSPSIEPPAATTSTASPMLIECPEPNCSKKYRHINGLKYHQSHAHGDVSSAGANGSGPAEANFDEDSSQDVPLVILKKDYPPTLTDEAVEVAPFTGKVPMPPPPELAPKPSSPRTPLPSLVFLSASSPSVIPTDASPSSKPDHLFSPIVTQPNTASTETAAATSWPTLSPSPVTPKAAEGATDPADRKERSKHKKKSKGKDRDRADKKDRSTSKKTPGTPAAATANGALNPSSPVVDSTPASANDGPATTTSSSLPTVSSAIVSATTDGLLPTPAADPAREDVQSPAYSDISDANDQSPSLLDTELIGSKKVGDNLAAEASACFSPVATGPGLGPFSMYPFYEQQPYMSATTDDQAGAKLSMNPEERNDKAPQTSVPGQQPQPPPGAPPGMYQPPSGMPIKDAVKGELMKSDSKMPPLLPIDSGAQPGIPAADLPGGAPSQGPAGPSSGAFDPALLYQQQQHQEDLRQFYNVYGGDDPMMWSGGPPPMSMFLPPMSSPGSGPHHDAAQQQQIMQHMQQQQIAQQQQFTQQYQQQQFAQQYQQQMQQQSLQFDPSQSVYRNTMESMLGGSPHSFGPSPGAGPFGMQHHPHQSSPGMRGYPSGPGFPGPTGEGPSRAHALEMLQRQANQYYATLAGPPAPPSAQGAGGVGAPPNGGGPGTPSPSFKSQQHKTPPPSPAVGHEKMSMGSGMVPPNASTIPTSSKVGSNMPMNRQVNSSMGPPPPPSSAGLLPPSSHHQYPPSGSPYGGPKPLLRP